MERTRAPQRYMRLNHTFGDCICIRRRGQCRRKKLRWSFFSLRFRFVSAAARHFQDPRFFLYALSALLRAAMLRARGGGTNRATHGLKTKRRFVFRAAFAARSRRLFAHGERRAQGVPKSARRKIFFYAEKSRNIKGMKSELFPYRTVPRQRSNLAFSLSSSILSLMLNCNGRQTIFAV